MSGALFSVAGGSGGDQLYPIGTRVVVTASGAAGTVLSWSYLMGLYYKVRLDEGREILVPAGLIERAMPRRDWFLHALVLETVR